LSAPEPERGSLSGEATKMPANHELSPEILGSLSGVPARRVPIAPRRHLERRGQAREYAVRLAHSPEEKAQAYRLRFLVFNVELNEGLESAFATGYDTDEFDGVCDHLVVEHRPTGKIIATYRMQTGPAAATNIGYYSEREFDFSPFEPLRNSLVEVGRAAILKEFRTFEALNLLWKGLAAYAVERGGRYLVGCSSLASQDPAEGIELYRQLEPFLAPLDLRTKPQDGFGLAASSEQVNVVGVTAPRLLRAYLNLGARICGAPALDREFKTIDFLTLLDLQALSPVARARFLDAA
jgi:putative hemolysin